MCPSRLQAAEEGQLNPPPIHKPCLAAGRKTRGGSPMENTRGNCSAEPLRVPLRFEQAFPGREWDVLVHSPLLSSPVPSRSRGPAPRLCPGGREKGQGLLQPTRPSPNLVIPTQNPLAEGGGTAGGSGRGSAPMVGGHTQLAGETSSSIPVLE